MSLTKSTDMVERSVARMHHRFSLPKWEGLLAAFVNRAQEVENAIAELKAGMLLGDAVGVQLDYIGAIVGQGRDSSDEDAYRLSIKAKGVVNASQGLPDDLLALALLLFPDGSAWEFSELLPNTIVIEFKDDWQDNFVKDPLAVALWFLAARTTGKTLFFISNGISADNTAEVEPLGYEYCFTLGMVGDADDSNLGLGGVGLTGDDRVGGGLVHVLNPSKPSA